MLEDYLKSLGEFRATCRSIGYPADYYEMLFYNMKKYFLNALALSIQDPAAYYYSAPSAVVYDRGKIRLLHYFNKDDVGGDSSNNIIDKPPILIVYSHINKFNILDISYDRSIVRNLQSNSLDVYILDWWYSGRREDDELSIEDYIYILGEAVDVVRSKTSREKISILGYCWRGILSLVFTVLCKPKVENLIMLATPVDFSKDNSLLSIWTKTVDADNMIKEYGHMNGHIIDLAFILRNPARNLYDKYFKMLKNISNKSYMDSFISVERWLYTTQPVPCALYHEVINEGYKQNHLVQRKLIVDNKVIDLNEIDILLLCIIAKKDDLVSPESTLAIRKYVSNKDVSTIEIPGGHVGLCISKTAHEEFWPKVARWIISHINNNKTISQQLVYNQE